MRPRLVPFVVAIALACSSGVGHAQLTSTPEYQVNGLRAILLTPAAALPQVVPAVEEGSRPYGTVAVRYGRYSFGSANYSNIAASAWANLGRFAQLGGTIGQRSCEGCEGSIMASVDLDARLYHKEGERQSDADTDVGLELIGGYGKAKVSDFKAAAIQAALPVAVSLPQSNDSRLTLFVSPGIAYGRLQSADSTIGALTRVVIGAGASLRFPGGLGAHVSGHRVITGDSPTQLGVALTWTFGARRKA
ncbi:MAG TPA: hypothetical protein VJ867_08895 [Gemmatimonadaceae bacterium]|nr:hypothetical protein [Gemmatimonadaceae bacterium]